MPRINKELLDALKSKLGLKQRRVYELIAAKANEELLDRHLAAVLLARDHGINVQKYATSEELVLIRGVQLQAPNPIPAPMVVKTVKIGDLVDFKIGFIRNKKLRGILSRDIRELNLAISTGLERAPKTCMVLSGSIAEALLLDALSRRKKKALNLAAKAFNKNPSNKLEEWDLFTMVKVASSFSPPLISEDAVAGATQLRRWRNLIHPGRELRDAKQKSISPTKAHARNAVSFLQLIGEQLSN